MKFEQIFWEYDIESVVRFNKELLTVYDLSYILIDFQAVINNMTEIIYDSMAEKFQIVKTKNYDLIDIIEKKEYEDTYVAQQHPSWQREIEKNAESVILGLNRKSADRTSLRLKQTTNRRFNRKHQMNLKLNGFSKGSLILDLANSLIVSILIEFLKELVGKKTGNEKIINTTINNQYILFDKEKIKILPKDSCVANAISFNNVNNQAQLEVKKIVHDVVNLSKPDENIEHSIRRLLCELKRNGIVNECVTYDERGIKTAVRDIERFVGNFMDVKI